MNYCISFRKKGKIKKKYFKEHQLPFSISPPPDILYVEGEAYRFVAAYGKDLFYHLASNSILTLNPEDKEDWLNYKTWKES